MGTRNVFNPCRPCCSTGCLLAAAWECNVKNGIVSADVTGWSVDAGTWDATQSWEAGIVADTLTTSSANARISCDTTQSSPLDGRTSVTHRIKLTNAADEAVILLNGTKVVIKSASVAVSGGGAVAVSTGDGIGLNTVSLVRVCIWRDTTTSKDFIGVLYLNAVTGGTRSLIAELTIVANGTTEFGCDAVTGAVSFHHESYWYHGRDGDFYHNTTTTGGSPQNCKSCSYNECGFCPGGDTPRYLTTAISGLSNPGYGGLCDKCTALNTSIINDMSDWDSTASTPSNACKSQCGRTGAGGSPCMTVCDSFNNMDGTGYIYTSAIDVITSIEEVVAGTSWRVLVEIQLWIYNQGTLGGYVYVGSIYHAKTFTTATMCTALDDNIPFDSVYPDWATFTTWNDCVGWDSLTVHVTASE